MASLEQQLHASVEAVENGWRPGQAGRTGPAASVSPTNHGERLAHPEHTSRAGDLERVLINGDLSTLKPEERIAYYRAVCESAGLNPLTKPFEYITLNGKLTLYARRDCTDQLRSRDRISIVITGRELLDDVYVVTAQARTPDGRTDESTGAVPIANLKGEPKANAYMKAETKAKRRVTLSICGLGLLDESEVASIPDARSAESVDAPPVLVEMPKPAPQPEPARTLNTKNMLARFEEMRESLGETSYWAVLHRFNVHNPASIQSLALAKQIWRAFQVAALQTTAAEVQ